MKITGDEVYTHDPGDRRGPYIQVGPRGRPFYLLDPRPEDVYLEDIAYSLAKLCRYNGHCIKHYSVAEHSIHVSHLVNHTLARWALLHDAEEAYTGDITRSMKGALETIAPGALKKLVDPIKRAVCERFKLDWPEPAEVKQCDTDALAAEVAQNMPKGECVWHDLPEVPRTMRVKCWTPRIAERMFHQRARELMIIEY